MRISPSLALCNWRSTIWFLIGLSLLLNLIALFATPLIPDEAYYWVWSERLQSGYYDHPPLIAWLIRLSTTLFGIEPWSVRLPAIASWFVGVWFAYRCSWQLYGHRRFGLVAAAIWASLPITQGGFHVVTPDTALIIMVWVVYYLLLHTLISNRPYTWILSGLAIGVALVAKYTAIVVPISLLMVFLGTRAGRERLHSPWPWVALIMAFVAFAPVVVWNAHNDWASFAFQLGHGVSKEVAQPLLLGMAFIGAQMLVVLPWTWVAMIYSAIRPRALAIPEATLMSKILRTGFWVPLILFGAAGLTRLSGPNWPIAAYVPGTLLLAGVLTSWLFNDLGVLRRHIFALLVAAFMVATALMQLVRYPGWLSYLGDATPAQRTQFSQGYGWERVADELALLLPELEASHSAGADCLIMGESLQTTAMIGFQLRSIERITTTPIARQSQFTLWAEDEPNLTEQTCLLLAQYNPGESVKKSIDLREWGAWHLRIDLEVKNPDLTVRHFGFYVR